MKVFKCRDVGVDCDWQIKSNDENEILRKAEEHGRQAHGMKEISDEMKQKVRSSIRDEKAA
jgi:predicted small metal-binding protein